MQLGLSRIAVPAGWGAPSARACRRHKQLRRVQAANTAPVAATQQLEGQLEDLLAQHSNLAPEALEERVKAIQELSGQLGTNKVTPEWNDGSFRAFPLSGRLKKVTASDADLTLGALTFGAVKPLDLQLAFRPSGRPPVFKGEWQGVQDTYLLTSAFSIVGHAPLGGLCEVVGSYSLDPAHPQRLSISFQEVVITPQLERQPGQWEALGQQQGAGTNDEDLLQSWLELVVDHNPTSALDPATGRLSVALPAPAPAWLDYIVMLPEWQMTHSHLGSVALLRRHGDAGGQ